MVINEIGNKYNKLTIIERDTSKKGLAYWICECECGNYCSVSGNNLRTGHTTSCGCARLTNKNKHYIQNLVGHSFGRLTVIEKTDKRINKRVVYKCQCSCENKTIVEVVSSNLTSGNTQSCGCLHRERSSESLTKLLLGKLGKDSFNYNPNITDEERENKRNTAENKLFREGVYLRDNYTCQRCHDNTGGNLNAHHKNSWNSFKDQRYDINNGITLCNKCHALFHAQFGYGNNTEEQLKNFFKASE